MFSEDLMMQCSIDSNHAKVRILSSALQQFCRDELIDDELFGQLELMLVEAVNNIIEHAYKNKPGMPIEAEFAATAAEVVLTIKDKGLPVPPKIVASEKKMPDASSLPEGGWGLALISLLADNTKYFTKSGTNTMVLTKRRDTALTA